MKNNHPETWHVGTSFDPYDDSQDLSLEHIMNVGFQCIELVLSGTEMNLNAEGLGRRFDGIMRSAHDLGLNVWSVHLPFGDIWDISTLDNTKRQKILNVHYDWLDWVGRWNVSHVIIHPSFEPIDSALRGEHLETCQKSLNKLADYADKLGIQVCVECLPRTCLGNQSLEIEKLISDHGTLGVCCDVNHLLHEQPEAFIAQIGTRIRTVHMSDYDGVDEKHWLPGQGIINWSTVLQALVQADYQGPFMFEVSYENADTLMNSWHHILRDYKVQISYGEDK